LCKIDGNAEVIHHAILVLIGHFTRLDRRRFQNTFARTHIFIEDYLKKEQEGQRIAHNRIDGKQKTNFYSSYSCAKSL